ncbi:hypothetical protein DXA63_15170, partial [Segatella copri]
PLPLTPPAIPFTHPCNSPSRPLLFPTRPERQKLLAQGIAWVFMSARLAPCRGKSFICRPESQALLVDSSFSFFMLRYACW